MIFFAPKGVVRFTIWEQSSFFFVNTKYIYINRIGINTRGIQIIHVRRIYVVVPSIKKSTNTRVQDNVYGLASFIIQ
jgi:hypothetical protein